MSETVTESSHAQCELGKKRKTLSMEQSAKYRRSHRNMKFFLKKKNAHRTDLIVGGGCVSSQHCIVFA